MLYALLFSLLFAGSGISTAQGQTDSLKLVDTAHPESFTEGEPDTVSFTFNKAIDTTAHFPGTGPLGFWRIIPVDSAEVDSIWVSEDLKTVNYRVDHKSQSDYTWLLESARAEDSTYLQRPYRLFYKLRSGEVNRFSVSGTVNVYLFKSESKFGTENLKKQQYIYYIPALSIRKPTGEAGSAYSPDSVKYTQFSSGGYSYEINGVISGTYWPILLERVVYHEDNWVKRANYLSAYDPNNDDRPDSIVVEGNDLNNIDMEYVDTSIEEPEERIESFQLKAYPNPFQDSFFVSLPEVSVSTDQILVSLYDIVGRKVFDQSYSRPVDDSRIKITPPKSVEEGVYILNVKYTESFRWRFKMIKQ